MFSAFSRLKRFIGAVRFAWGADRELDAYDAASLGLYVKGLAGVMRGIDDEAYRGAGRCVAAMTIAMAEAREQNAGEFTFVARGCTSSGVPIGDWELIVRQVSPEESARRDAAQWDKGPGEIVTTTRDGEPQMLDRFDGISKLAVSIDPSRHAIKEITVVGTPKAA